MSTLNSSGWLRGKKEKINPGNKDSQNALSNALNYQNIETHPERISILKPYIGNYNWEGIDFPAEPKDWKKFEPSNKKTALNILFIPPNTKKVSVAYRSKYNRKSKNQVIFLMITDS